MSKLGYWSFCGSFCNSVLIREDEFKNFNINIDLLDLVIHLLKVFILRMFRIQDID
ncbi:hypothetical protein WN55_04942 [Dufourea novaeangliae]|uniref:Uncharacterized protein n=1 Tax=Dufourea novaeangliae TaxID=178035 RepID=A0A154PME7_DUFNO|nr:hypothetical protein WN55_04942 [Dufourea novaeangliae]